MIETCEIEALFGSLSRGDDDELSDKDIIIIDNDYKLLKQRTKYLEKQGASVAAYSWSRFQSLVNKKGLFVQHLKLEARILVDREGRFGDTLRGYIPKFDYENEINDNKKLLQLIETYPATPRGVLWAADVLYVALRNYGILRLAEEKKYIFSFEGIINELCELNILSKNFKSEFIKLRLLKSLYRNHEPVPISYSYEFFSTLLAHCPKDFFINTPICLNAYSIAIECEELPATDAPPYVLLRKIEKLYLTLLDVSPSLNKIEKFKLIKKWIEDPRQYGCLAMKDAPNVFNLLRDESRKIILNKNNRLAIFISGDHFREEGRKKEAITLRFKDEVLS